MSNVDSRYRDGTYAFQNPGWHEADSQWKAERVVSILADNGIRPSGFCDIGCGTGGVLRELLGIYRSTIPYSGLDVSESLIEKARSLSGPDIEFDIWDGSEPHKKCNVALVLDVVEHVPDYLGFLEELNGMAEHYVFHIPLDMNAQVVGRQQPIMNARRSVGHLHYFSKETALASLEYAGFKILDIKFTPSWETVSEPPLLRRIFS